MKFKNYLLLESKYQYDLEAKGYTVTKVIPTSSSNWFEVYLAIDKDNESEEDIKYFEEDINTFKVYCEEATTRLTHLGFKSLGVKLFVVDDDAFGYDVSKKKGIYKKQEQVIAIPYLSYLKNKKKTMETIIHEWAHHLYFTKFSKDTKTELIDYYIKNYALYTSPDHVIGRILTRAFPKFMEYALKKLNDREADNVVSEYARKNDQEMTSEIIAKLAMMDNPSLEDKKNFQVLIQILNAQ